MSNKRIDEIEKINDDIPQINITPNFTQAVLISIAFFALAILVSYLTHPV